MILNRLLVATNWLKAILSILLRICES